jgi:tRNA-uridine 2-sulfurtransferase
MNKQTVVIALSGGVDSAVAALLLKRQGYKVIAAFMKNFSDSKDPVTGQCSWKKEKLSAQKIASHLNIPLVTFDFEKEYKSKVIKPMINSYKQGKTPNPDISCNSIIKFPLFWKKAQKYKPNYMATGHYARIKKTKKNYQLLSGKDKTKDQSYFLSELSQEELKHTLFPVGNLIKEEVRKIAKKNKFPNHDKKSTSGICFVGKVNLKSFLEKSIKNKPGLVLSPNNQKIGTHPGISYYTIGQRAAPSAGINLDKTNKKYYIAKKKGNTLIAAPEGHKILKTKTIKIKTLKLINPKNTFPKNLKARIRHLGPLLQGNLIKNTFTLKNPIQGIAPGQQIVLYKNQELIASGQIAN